MPFEKVDIQEEPKEKKYATGGLIEDRDREKILKQTIESEGYILTEKQAKEFSRIIEILNKIYAGKYKKEDS